MRPSNPDFWWIVAAGVIVFVILAVALKQTIFALMNGKDDREVLFPPPAQLPSNTNTVPPSEEEEDPRCLACGDPASERMPSIERSRGARDWLRELFAMPPRYRRVVKGEVNFFIRLFAEIPKMRPDLCKSHAHVADAMVEEFIHLKVRGAFTAAYTKVAVEAAGFEKEFLQKQLNESLTEDQKRAQKRAASPVTRLLKTANGDSPVST